MTNLSGYLRPTENMLTRVVVHGPCAECAQPGHVRRFLSRSRKEEVLCFAHATTKKVDQTIDDEEGAP